MKKFKFNDLKKIINKNNLLIVHILLNLQNQPTFHPEKRWVNLVKGRDCFVGLPILLDFG